MAQVVIQGLSKVYPGNVEAVSAVDLTIEDGILFVIVGPSGSGKSTLLRLVAGLETPSAGSLSIGGRKVDALPPRDRDVAMVFQDAALYPYLSVFNNLAFGLRARRFPRGEIVERVESVAARLGLDRLLDRKPSALSGGERQRVALGRAIVRQPAVLLLDEPLSSLDAPLRASLRAELVDLHRRFGTTMIHVTHDQAEALAMGDRIAVMNRGRIVQAGPPLEVYHRPAHRFVAEFVGSPPMNLLPCVVERVEGKVRIRIAETDEPIGWCVDEGESWVAPISAKPPGRFDLGLRPEHLALSDPKASSDLAFALSLGARVHGVEPLGHETIVSVMVGPHRLNVRLRPQLEVRAGELVSLHFDPGLSTWFDPDSGDAIRSV